jgi:hypothetical protein
MCGILGTGVHIFTFPSALPMALSRNVHCYESCDVLNRYSGFEVDCNISSRERVSFTRPTRFMNRCQSALRFSSWARADLLNC